MNDTTPIKTIGDRWKSLSQWELDNDEKVILETHVTETRQGWMAETKVILDGKVVANDFIEKHFQECGQSTLSTAATQSKSRAIAVFLREEHIHSKEEIQDLKREERRKFVQYLNTGPKEKDIKVYIREHTNQEVRTVLNKVYSDWLSDKIKNQV